MKPDRPRLRRVVGVDSREPDDLFLAQATIHVPAESTSHLTWGPPDSSRIFRDLLQVHRVMAPRSRIRQVAVSRFRFRPVICRRHANPKNDVSYKPDPPDKYENEKECSPQPCRHRSMFSESSAHTGDLLIGRGFSQISYAVPKGAWPALHYSPPL
jgi:hypothetical protein